MAALPARGPCAPLQPLADESPQWHGGGAPWGLPSPAGGAPLGRSWPPASGAPRVRGGPVAVPGSAGHSAGGAGQRASGPREGGWSGQDSADSGGGVHLGAFGLGVGTSAATRAANAAAPEKRDEGDRFAGAHAPRPPDGGGAPRAPAAPAASAGPTLLLGTARAASKDSAASGPQAAPHAAAAAAEARRGTAGCAEGCAAGRAEGCADGGAEGGAEGGRRPQWCPCGLSRVLSWRWGPAQRPACWSASWVLLALGASCLGLALLPVEVETSLEAFAETDVDASLVHSAFMDALGHRDGDSLGRRLEDGWPVFVQFDLYLAYELRDPSATFFNAGALKAVAAFEVALRGLPEWDALCQLAHGEYRALCEPGTSFVGFAVPSRALSPGSAVPTALATDGRGGEALPAAAAVHLAGRHGLAEVLFPIGYGASATPDEGPTALRSAFRLLIQICTTADPESYRAEQNDELVERWKAFAGDVLMPFIREWSEDQDIIKIWFGGTDIETTEVTRALRGDLALAGTSLLVVLLCMAAHLRSALLAVGGLAAVGLSVPLSYVVLVLLKGLDTRTTVASLLAVFLVVGLGADAVLVYDGFWVDSARWASSDEERLAWTYRHGGRATLAASAAAALAFLAGLVSVLRPLREFGVFAGTCAMASWLLVSLVYPPLRLLHERRGGCCCAVGCPGGIFAPGSRPDAGPEPRGPARASSPWARWLQPRRVRYPLCFLSLTAVLTTGILAATGIEADGELPSLFPEDHNQNRGREVFALFAPAEEVFRTSFTPRPLLEAVCGAGDAGDVAACPLRWCEAEVPSAPDACQCFEERPAGHGSGACGAASAAEAEWRFAFGAAGLSEQEAQDVASGFLSSDGAVEVSTSIPSGKQPPPMVVQEWPTGRAELAGALQVTASYSPGGASSGAPCHRRFECFCHGTYVCDLGSSWDKVQPSAPVGRLLTGTTTPRCSHRGATAAEELAVTPMDGAVVEVSFGIDVLYHKPFLGGGGSDESWAFREDFDVRQPWAQRDLLALCTNLSEELKVAERRCWIEDFKAWVESAQGGNEEFPVPFGIAQDKLATWARTSKMGTTPGSDYLWIRDGLVKACYMRFYLDVSPSADRDAVARLRSHWDSQIAAYNLGASEYAKGALHTSLLWARSDSQEALLSSLSTTLAIISVLAFLPVLALTRNLALSAVAISGAVGAVAGLAFFMSTVVGWPVGGIEVLLLTALAGPALDYPLHVVHRYGSDEALGRAAATSSDDVRLQRVSDAVASTGGAALGSALATALGAALLLFCTLTVFVKIGAVVLVVTSLSIFAALVAVPAALLTFGPARPTDVCLVAGGLPRLLRGPRRGGSCAKGEQVLCGVAVETPGGQLTEPPPESEDGMAYSDGKTREAQAPERQQVAGLDAEDWDPGPDSQAVAACPVDDPLEWDPSGWEVSHEPSLPRRPGLPRI